MCVKEEYKRTVEAQTQKKYKMERKENDRKLGKGRENCERRELTVKNEVAAKKCRKE